MLIGGSVYKRYWNDWEVNIFRVYLALGASETEVKRRMLELLGNQRRLFVMTNREVRQYIIRLTDQWFGITYVQIAVAVVVAAPGLINTLAPSLTSRPRGIGRIRASGGVWNTLSADALSEGGDH